MPNGTTAPGNVLPAPPPVPWSAPPGRVPTKGLTHFAKSVAWAAAAGTAGATAAVTANVRKAKPALKRARAIAIASHLISATQKRCHDNLVAQSVEPGHLGQRLTRQSRVPSRPVHFGTA